MVIHVEHNIRDGKVTVKRDGTVALVSQFSTEVLAALDAAKVQYSYEELGHTERYAPAMEWRNEPEKKYGPQPEED